jgi:ElaB/YqjD/DUF883 family membrane-anchored ribosome-binding protein
MENASDEATGHARSYADKSGHEGTDMGSQIREKAQDMATSVEKLGSQASEVATQYYQQGREQVEEWEKFLKAQLREKPLQSLAIAGGVGLVLGLLLRRS